MHGRMHPNYWQITILLVVDLCSSLSYFMMTQPLPIAGKLPIKTLQLVARQLPTNTHTHTYTHNSYLTVIGVHEMHGRMHPNYWQITILLVVDLCSSLAYFMMTHVELANYL